MFLECLEEQFVIFGVRIAGVVNVVIRRVDPRRRKLQAVRDDLLLAKVVALGLLGVVEV